MIPGCKFIDKDGQVNKKRFEKISGTTGEFPYKVSAGYMMTEDFLKKIFAGKREGGNYFKRA